MNAKQFVHPTSLAKTAASLRSGELDLLAYYTRLLDHIDAVEPHVQAFIPEPDRRQRLMAAAEALLARYPTPTERPPLFGIPLGVKDIIQVEGFITRAGSQLPPDELTGPEAESVRLLRATGALVVGKTVTTEFAYFAPGPTRNPHNLAHTPGGSSSGSAASVAAGMALLTMGTQTIGSVIRPAAFCGIVGYKPTYGCITTSGLLYFSRSADHIGLFTYDVAGMSLAASVVCGHWQPNHPPHKPVLAIPQGPYLQQAAPEALHALAQQVQQLEDAGFTIQRIPLLADIAEMNQNHGLLIAAEFAKEHAKWFAEFGHLYRPRTAALIRKGQQADPDQVEEIRSAQAIHRQEIEHVMDVHGIDLWICPAAPGPAPAGIDSTGDPIMNLPWTYMGLPAVTVPAGFAANGLPLGLQLVGHWQADEMLLAWAEDIAPVVNKR
ncbi:MAG: amidase [Chloroflexi bacterium]|nr:amidase [Chloroflexota bacterium]